MCDTLSLHDALPILDKMVTQAERLEYYHLLPMLQVAVEAEVEDQVPVQVARAVPVAEI
jgi:hypothetical protein